MSETPSNTAIVVGAGVVGICSALALQKKGYRVTLLDPAAPGSQTSLGNAGAIAVTEVLPLSLPGIIWKTPKWLLDPGGPLSIRWRHLPYLTPWLWRFFQAGSNQNIAEIIPVLTDLLKPVYADFKPLLREAGIEKLLHKNGSLTLYHHYKTYKSESREWALKREQGIRFETVTADEIRGLEPALAPVFEMGVRNLDWGHVDDPYQISIALFELFIANGGKYKPVAVKNFAIEQGVVKGVLSEAGEHFIGQKIIIAAGVWSRDLLKQLHCKVSLESERGYHVTFADADKQLNNMIISAEGKFVMTPMTMGLRVAGTAEFSGLVAAAQKRRSDVLVKCAKKILPDLNTQEFSRWHGHRPATPDSLPVISVVPHHPNVFCAFGHGHLGLTLGPTTGRLLADLVCGDTDSHSLHALRINRF